MSRVCSGKRRGFICRCEAARFYIMTLPLSMAISWARAAQLWDCCSALVNLAECLCHPCGWSWRAAILRKRMWDARKTVVCIAGKASGYMLLSSLFFDLRTEHALKPYVMLSGGYREPSLTLTQGNSPIFHDRSGLLGGGGGVGVSLNEDDSIILDMDYRYLHNLKEDGVGTSHMTFIGVRFLDL